MRTTVTRYLNWTRASYAAKAAPDWPSFNSSTSCRLFSPHSYSFRYYYTFRAATFRLCDTETVRTTTATLNGSVQNRIKIMMMPMDLRDNDLKPVGNGNWEEIKKKIIQFGWNLRKWHRKWWKVFFSKWRNRHIAVLVPQIYGKWLKKCISGRIWVIK